MDSGDDPGGEEPDADDNTQDGGEPPRSRRATTRRGDPVVEITWLGRRLPRRRGPLPRPSTVLLLAAFVAVLMLYLMLKPS
ncbi:hypothetical protein [Nocardia paucivorans]|uniref:hypothetical protein n=1 Tax=Nocardia paucivorans TaxID=114259 RepID=UPI0005939DB6|nr:hypothetical protein [Nocardia paucivorans]